MAAPTPQDLIKRKALNKLEQYLKEHFLKEEECPLKTFNFTSYQDSFSKEEFQEISPIVNRLSCTWKLKNECDLMGITVICPYTKAECDFKCGTE